jgi:hypothetical protein
LNCASHLSLSLSFSLSLFLAQIRGKTLNRSANSEKLAKLSSNTRYLICVLGLGNWLTYHDDLNNLVNESNRIQNQIITNQNGYENGENMLSSQLLSLLMDTPTSRCTEVRTLDSIAPLVTEMDGLSGENFIQSILSRRLGLIVGCCLGIVVFIILISVLGWLKVQKQRIVENAKRAQSVQPELISYRHFSITNEKQNRTNGNYNLG